MAARPSFEPRCRRTRRPSPGSAPGSTGCRWRSSWRPPAIRLLSPDAILTRLERQFELLASAARDVPERQRTLRGAIAWSYDLLDEPEPAPPRAAGLLRRRLRPRDGRARSAARPRSSAATCSTGSPSSPTRASSAGPRPTARSASRCPRRSARSPSSDSRRAARPTRSGAATPRPSSTSPGPPRRELSGRRPAALARAARARARQPPRGARLGGRRRPIRRSPSGSPIGCGGSGRSAATSSEARRRLDDIAAGRGRRTIRPPTPGCSRRSAGSPTGRATSAARSRPTGRRSSIWRERRRPAPRSPTPSTTSPSPTTSTRTRTRSRRPTTCARAGRSSRRRWRSTASSATSAGSATSCGRSAAPTCSPADSTWRCRSSRRRAQAFKAAGDRTMEAWALHMIGVVRRPARATSRRPRTPSGTRSATSRRPATSPARRSIVDDFATLALASGDKERGIRLWAAARRIQETLGTGLVQAQIDSPGSRPGSSPGPSDATPERRAELEAEGRSWTLEEALAYATRRTYAPGDGPRCGRPGGRRRRRPDGR